MKLFLTLATLVFLLSSCAGSKRLYYWGNYSESLYNLKKEPGDESIAKHKMALIEIINTSKKEHKKVPPGIYSEFAYMLLKEGKPEKALKFLALEEKIYPESIPFIKHLKNKIKQSQEQL